MSFSKAFERAGMKSTKPKEPAKIEMNPEKVPMMYRAQVSGRCSLQFAGKKEDKKHLDKWCQQWVYPKIEKDPQPRHQFQEPKIGCENGMYRIKIEFPFRLASNCGQDNILRPIMGKNGIPYLSGSSVKGLFSRACNENQRKLYCGAENEKDKSFSPSAIGLRFHGAYPIGDWSGMRKVTVKKKDGRRGETEQETCYRMLDVIHPQQLRQVGDPSARDSASVYTMVSLYQPTMVFEFSSADPQNTNWEEVENLFLGAIQLGVGGKTSTGYGLGGHLPDHQSYIPSYPITVAFKGRGVSPTLRSDEPEFRPNLFKATLRGHIKRLLAGVTQSGKDMEERLFGSSSAPGELQIFWQETSINYNEIKKPATFSVEGILHIEVKKQKCSDIKKQKEIDDERKTDLNFVKQVLKFSFVMGGFGKSWRRVSHAMFYKDYEQRKYEIGCHWELATTLKWIDIKSIESLKQFLGGLHKLCCDRFGSKPLSFQGWREAWHPERLTVYAKVTKESSVVKLFHNDTFKTTPAIGGRNPHKEHPAKTKPPEFFSCVWHRMLPIENDKYLEIVTVFHGDRTKWKHKDGGDQLGKFLEAIVAKDLVYVWGNQNPLKNTPKQSSSNPKPQSLDSNQSKPILKPKPPQK